MSLLARLFDTLTRWICGAHPDDRFDIVGGSNPSHDEIRVHVSPGVYQGYCDLCGRVVTVPYLPDADPDLVVFGALQHMLDDPAAHAAYLQETT